MRSSIPRFIFVSMSQRAGLLSRDERKRLPGSHPRTGFVRIRINILTKGGQKVHQALDREVARLPPHQTRNVRLFDAQYCASLRLCESSNLDNPVDLEREAGLELLTLGVGKAEVGKDV